jgi:thiol-disulfide isomerase/thioredoxin
MFKKILLISAFVLPFLIVSGAQAAEEKKVVEIWFFNSIGCAHCAQARPVLQQLAQDNPSVHLIDLELNGSTDNQILFGELAATYGEEADGVPSVAIGDQWIVGYDPATYRSVVKNCLENTCENPSDKLKAWQAANPDAIRITDLERLISPESDVMSELVFGLVFIFGIGIVSLLVWKFTKK